MPYLVSLTRIGSHFSFFSCTHTCTHAYGFRMDGCQSAIRFVEVADLLSLPTTGLGQPEETALSELAVIHPTEPNNSD